MIKWWLFASQRIHNDNVEEKKKKMFPQQLINKFDQFKDKQQAKPIISDERQSREESKQCGDEREVKMKWGKSDGEKKHWKDQLIHTHKTSTNNTEGSFCTNNKHADVIFLYGGGATIERISLCIW